MDQNGDEPTLPGKENRLIKIRLALQSYHEKQTSRKFVPNKCSEHIMCPVL